MTTTYIVVYVGYLYFQWDNIEFSGLTKNENFISGLCAEDDDDHLPHSSTVESLEDPITGLFGLLTEQPDALLRWTTYTYPAHLDILSFHPHGVRLELETEGLSEFFCGIIFCWKDGL